MDFTNGKVLNWSELSYFCFDRTIAEERRFFESQRLKVFQSLERGKGSPFCSFLSPSLGSLRFQSYANYETGLCQVDMPCRSSFRSVLLDEHPIEGCEETVCLTTYKVDPHQMLILVAFELLIGSNHEALRNLHKLRHQQSSRDCWLDYLNLSPEEELQVTDLALYLF